MYADIEGVALAIVAKAGSQSFTESGNTWYMNNNEALVYPERIFFIRDPLQRLESCYSFFVGLARSGVPHSSIPVANLDSWELFVDYILDPKNEDEHWIPQTETVLYTGDALEDKVYVPTKIMRFEDVTKWWPNFFSRRLPHNNQSERLITTVYRSKELQEKYANDYAIYDKLVAYDDLQDSERGWPLEQGPVK